MALEMQLYQIEGGDHYRPVVTCDHCLQPVQPARTGTVVWQIDERGAPSAGGALYFTHKHCWRGFQAVRGGHGRWVCEECLTTSS
jgi:hypothetical protein